MLKLLDITPDPRPLHQDKVDDAVSGIAIASGIPRPGVSVVDDVCGNAFTILLRGGKARLCLISGLIEALSREELTGVVAHEYAHIRNGDLDRLHVTRQLLFRLFNKRLRERRWLGLVRS